MSCTVADLAKMFSEKWALVYENYQGLSILGAAARKHTTICLSGPLTTTYLPGQLTTA